MTDNLYEKKLERLAYVSFLNALQFHYDSAVMLGISSFASAIFTSIHAQEELGKFFLIDNLCLELKDGTKTLTQAEKYLRENVMRDHTLKQFYFGISVGNIPQFEKYINNPRNIQDLRNDVLYARINNKSGRVISPTKKATKNKALYQIRFVNGALQELMWYAYDKQHSGLPPDDWVNTLSNNTVWPDFIMVDEMCAYIFTQKANNKVLMDRDLLEYFELIKNEYDKKIYLNSFHLYRACRRYQRDMQVKRFITY